MKKTIPFKLEIDNVLIIDYEVTDKNIFLFNINSETFTLKKLCNLFELNIICDDCGIKTIIKNIQQNLKLNKPYLCRSCRNKGNRNGMFGKHHTEETIKLLSEKHSGKNNHFYGKKHTYETLLKQKNAKAGLYIGNKNPMYGKTFFDIWVEKYGLDIALIKLSEKGKKHSKCNSGSNNPMYGKTIMDIWVEKYGLDKANELYSIWIFNIKNTLSTLFKNNDDLKSKISLSLKNRIFTDKHKLNLRLSSIEYIKRKMELNGGRIVPHFNIYACQLLDEIAKIKNINIQHALNGGEYYISELCTQTLLTI